MVRTAPPEGISKKKKSFSKSFKGFITGESKRKKKALSKSAPALLKDLPPTDETTAAPILLNDQNTVDADEETLYGADFDNKSVMSKDVMTVLTSDEKEEKKAEHNGPLIQVIQLLIDPASRRFELLQLEFDSLTTTVEDILKQIPLSATEESLRTISYKYVCDANGKEMDQSKLLNEYIPESGIVIAVAEGGASYDDAYKLAKPILSDPKVINMLNSVGIDVDKIHSEEEKSIVTSPSKEVEKNSMVTSPSKEVDSKPATNNVVASPAKTAPSTTPVVESTSNHLGSTLFILYLLFALLSNLTVLLQERITAPLKPGDKLSPGEWRSKCGLLIFLPNNDCDLLAVEMSRSDGILNVYNGEEVIYSLKGAVCDEDNDACVPGAVFNADNTFTIGGVPAKLNSDSSPISLDPWPFTGGVRIHGKRELKLFGNLKK